MIKHCKQNSSTTEADEFGGDGYGNQRHGGVGRGAMGGYGGQYDQGGLEAPYMSAGRGAGRGATQGSYSALRTAAYGGQEGWNQSMPVGKLSSFFNSKFSAFFIKQKILP